MKTTTINFNYKDIDLLVTLTFYPDGTMDIYEVAIECKYTNVSILNLIDTDDLENMIWEQREENKNSI